MARETQFWLVLMAIGALVMLMIPAFRSLMSAIFGRLLMPAFLAISGTISLWIFWLLKTVVTDHFQILRNLLSPRSVIYKSLRSDADD
jgi:hypothetical protein